ncbi:hypothetical protein ASG04_10170 [Curtobacterium sp. Leaf183]|uniref:hypothetical protein n=1 Tax=Curtobacterium sp. Leaf183 TaxID=1736291 RepID=UPI0006F931EA|nr:hypothetical protein [Curtobacterium sp. Leaf183]KQS09226.1 hypothetical protein ASG04_10170 [Curtobacterium sp. Leaf183]
MNATSLRQRPARRILIAAATIAVLMPLSLSACSTSSDAGSGSSTASGVGAKWGACMRDAGFEVEDPDDASVEAGLSKPPAGVDGAEFADASSSCSDEAGIERSSSADHQKWARQYAQVASCIRENGYDDFPEQQPGSIGTEGYPRAEEPEFNDVMDDCLAEFAPDTQSQSVG